MKSDRIIQRSADILSGEIDDFIQEVTEYKDNYSKYGSIYITSEEYWECGDSYNRIVIEYRSPETDDEYDKRIAEEVARKTDQEYRERIQYERLKEKYGE